MFTIDVTVCRNCGGRMRVLAVVTDPDDIAHILHGARAPPQFSAFGGTYQVTVDFALS